MGLILSKLSGARGYLNYGRGIIWNDIGLWNDNLTWYE